MFTAGIAGATWFGSYCSCKHPAFEAKVFDRCVCTEINKQTNTTPTAREGVVMSWTSERKSGRYMAIVAMTTIGLVLGLTANAIAQTEIESPKIT